MTEAYERKLLGQGSRRPEPGKRRLRLFGDCCLDRRAGVLCLLSRGDLLFPARFLALVDPAAATTNSIADEKPEPGQNKQAKSHRACAGYWIPIWSESNRSTGQRVLIAVGWRI
jgi:hypothetical protein